MLATGVVVAVSVASTLVTIVLILIFGLLIYQTCTKRRIRSVLVQDLEDQRQQPPMIQIRKKATLQKGYKREIPLTKGKVLLGQEKHGHGSWIVPLTAGSDIGYRTSHDAAPSLSFRVSNKSGTPSRRQSFAASLENLTGSVAIRQSIDLNSDAVFAIPSPGTLQRELNIFDPDYVPVNRRIAQVDDAFTLDQAKTLSAQVSHRRVVSHPGTLPPKRSSSQPPPTPRASSLTTPRRRGQSSTSARRSRSVDGSRIPYEESKVLVNDNHHPANDITSPPQSATTAVRAGRPTLIDTRNKDGFASGQWLADLVPFGDFQQPQTPPTELELDGPGGPHAGIRSPSQMLKPNWHVSNPYDITMGLVPRPLSTNHLAVPAAPVPSRSSSGSSSSQSGPISPPQNATSTVKPSFEYNKRFMHSALSITTQGRALSPLNEFSEPATSIRSRSEFSDSTGRSVSSRSTIRGRSYDDEDISPRTTTAPPLPEFTYRGPNSPALSSQSIDSETFSDRTVLDIHGLRPRPRPTEDQRRANTEELTSQDGSGTSGSVTPRALWSPSYLSLSATASPFEPRESQMRGPFMQPPQMANIQDAYGLNVPSHTLRESMATRELEEAVRTMGERLNWSQSENESNTESQSDSDAEKKPKLDKGKGRALEPRPSIDVRQGARSREGEAGRQDSFQLL
jgi:hypothetical protein